MRGDPSGEQVTHHAAPGGGRRRPLVMSLFGSRSWFVVADSVATDGAGTWSGSTGSAGNADRTARPHLGSHNADAHRFRTMREETDT
jgi:hypothetical protein